MNAGTGRAIAQMAHGRIHPGFGATKQVAHKIQEKIAPSAVVAAAAAVRAIAGTAIFCMFLNI